MVRDSADPCRSAIDETDKPNIKRIAHAAFNKVTPRVVSPQTAPRLLRLCTKIFLGSGISFSLLHHFWLADKEKGDLRMRRLLVSSSISTLLLVAASIAAAQTVTGSGTSGTVPRWTGSSTLANSSIRADSNGLVGINAAPTVNARLYVLSALGYAVKGEHTSNGTGLFGLSVSGTGVRGESEGGGIGLRGLSQSGSAILGSSTSGNGLRASSSSSDGVYAWTNSSDPAKAGVHAFANMGALAGLFEGNVSVTGTLSKGGGSFKIDHPLDPENKYLFHSFVESPEMLNIYNGNITTDGNGEAVVEMPDYFEALNSDFRYQLTVIGTFAQAIVSKKIENNRFVIKTSAPSVEVSWQVTGVRQDAWAKQNRIKVEVEKTGSDRGRYLHPEAFTLPESLRVGTAHDQQ
jgi:hypothetical protein